MSEHEIQNRIVGIIGRKGTGKSTYLEDLLQGEPRLVVFDPMAEHDWSPNELPTPDELRKFALWSRKRKFCAANYVAGDDVEEEIEAVSELIYQFGSITFAVEEVALICSPSYLPPKFGKLVRTGRHRFINLYWTAQRAGEVSRTLTSLTDEFVLFSQTEPRDLDAIASRCGPEVADRVAHLGRHDHITWDVIARRLVEAPRPASLNPSKVVEIAS